MLSIFTIAFPLEPVSSYADALAVAFWSASRDSLMSAFAEEFLSLPSLLRFLAIVAAIVALAYGAMVAIVSVVTPQPREMTYTIPTQRLNK